MQLSGMQVAHIRDTLLAAFSKDSLREMVRIELDETLETIAGGDNLRVVVFNLVTWAEQNGRIIELIHGAYNQTPQNEQVRQLVLDALTWRAAAKRVRPPLTQTNTAPQDLASQLHLPPTAIDVFLSYSRKDSDAMRRANDSLRSAGLSVWIDEGLKPGTPSWTSAIQEAIRQADVFVVLLSPNAAASTWVNNEISYAQMQHKSCFPLLVAGDATNVVPIALVNVQWIDGRQDLAKVIDEQLVPALTHRDTPTVLHPSAMMPAPVEAPAIGDASSAVLPPSVQSFMTAVEQLGPLPRPVTQYTPEFSPLPKKPAPALSSLPSKGGGATWLAKWKKQTILLSVTDRKFQIFVAMWAALSTLGFAVGMPVGVRAIDPVISSGDVIIYGVVGAVLGVMVGASQWIILRQYLPRAYWWVVVSAVGWSVGAAVATVFFGVMVGVVVGASQWIFLRRYLSKAYWWVVASAVGMGMGGFLLEHTWLNDLDSAIYDAFGWVAHRAAVGVLVGLVFGVTTAIAMFWLLKRRRLDDSAR